MLISTPCRAVIENNLFESSGSAILVAGDSNYWYESGAVRDVLGRDVFLEKMDASEVAGADGQGIAKP